MALIRGGSFSNFPCPRCLVPGGELADLSKTADPRTAEDMKEVLESARGQRLLTEKEEILKNHRLRDVDVRHPFYSLHTVLSLMMSKNVFWRIWNSDPHAALSFDRLHTFPGGIFCHLWDHVQSLLKDSSRKTRAQIDKTYVIFYILL